MIELSLLGGIGAFLVAMYYLSSKDPSQRSDPDDVFLHVNSKTRPQTQSFHPTHTSVPRTGHDLHGEKYMPVHNGAYLRNGEPVEI